ncbi:MAG: transporter substrate-binding domain-containing protein [Microcystaceae cyanobacterium]
MISFAIWSPLVKAAELEEIIKRGKLIVGVKDNLPPLGSYDNQDQLVGLEIDIAKRLAEEILGDQAAIDFKPVKNQERLTVVIEGEVDIVIARVTFTESRNRVVDFSPYYYLDGTGLITRQSNIKTVAQLSESKIAVLRNSNTIAVLRSALPNATLVGVNSYQEALTLLENETVTAFAGDNSVLTGWVQEYPQYYRLPFQLSGEALCIVMPKGLQYRQLRARVNEAIVGWHKSGWLRERALYWGLPVINLDD